MNSKLHTSSVGIIALVAVLAAAPAASQQQTVTILHTSDMHGSVLPWDDFRDRPADGSLAQVSTMAKAIRAEAGHPVLLLDSGDTIQGTPLEQFVHVRWSEPSPIIAAMNEAGYDAMAVGNHEFNFGLEVLDRARRQAGFPLLSANSVNAATGEPAFPTHAVFTAGEVRVGVIGLVTPNIPGWERPEHYRGLAFRPMSEVAAELAVHLREDEGCDLIVVLAHTGFERGLDDGTTSGTEYENFAWRLSRVPGIDLLLTGHTHENIPPRMLDGVIVSQPAARARFLTRIDLVLEPSDDGWRIASWDGWNLPTADAEPDPAITKETAAAHRRVAESLDGPVGRVEADLSVAGCRLHDCAPLDLIHAVQLDASGAELSLASLLTDRTPDLAAGPVTWRWVYAFYVYPNTLVKLQLTGRQIADVLEHSARYYRGVDCAPDGPCAVVTDADIPRYNVDTIEGMSYRIDPTRPEGQRVRDLRFDGRPVDPERRFTIVCNNYRAAGGGGFPHLAEAEVVWQSSEEMADLIGDYLARAGSWYPEINDNWRLGPAMTTERAAPAGP